YDGTAPYPGSGAHIDDMRSPSDGVLVVFDDHQRIAVPFQQGQGVEQNPVVAGVQADGRFVQHVTDPLQVGTQLCRQANPLGFTTGQGGRGTIQGQVAESHL